jgi:adenylate kinase
MKILITGTPGTGKSTLGKKIAKALRLQYVDIHSYVIKHKLHDGYDRTRKCYLIPEKTLRKIANLYADDVVLDSHMSHEIKSADVCIVTTCDLSVLSKRLQKRKYNASKIAENVEAEAFEICKMEAIEKGHKVLVVDTSKKFSMRYLLLFLKKTVSSKKRYHEL